MPPVGFAADFAAREPYPELGAAEVGDREDRRRRAGQRDEAGQRAGPGGVQRQVDPFDAESADAFGHPGP